MTESLLEVRQLTKKFGSLRAVDEASFSLGKGEAVAVIGPSGSGKSTFLRCLNFLETPDAGEIYFRGELIRHERASLRKLRSRVGMVFQHFHLFPHRNVVENITLAPKQVLGLDDAAARDRALSLLKMVGLAEKETAMPAELSGGQKQRVAIARTMAMEPDLILFDEPTSALDPETVGEVLRCMRKVRDQGVSMMIVTHEIPFVKGFADRLVFFDQGKISETGPLPQTLDEPGSQRLQEFLQALDYSAI